MITRPYLFSALLLLSTSSVSGSDMDWRNLKVGVLSPGTLNAITDVEGVMVGHVTLNTGTDCRTGVTAVLPHPGNIFQQKVPAAIYIANGFGKLTGISQVNELGWIETPLILTNTLSVPVAAQAVVQYVLSQPGNENVRSVNPVVGETNDDHLNDIRSRFVRVEDVLKAIETAEEGAVHEGVVGAGTGTVCFGFKGGIGTSSRRLPGTSGGYTIGVLVQTNFGGILRINGAPVGEELGQYYSPHGDGSCMIVVATDAPLDARQLKRLAKRAAYGLVRTGGISSHGSGDYAIAFSTFQDNFVSHSPESTVVSRQILRDDALSPLFLAATEATEEAIYHSLFLAETVKGFKGHSAEKLPLDKVIKILERHDVLEFRDSN